MNILFLTTVLPSHKLHGSEIASQNLVEGLEQAGCQVRVVGYARKEDGHLQYTAHEIEVAARSVETKEAKGQALLWLFRSILKNAPYSAEKYRTEAYIQQVQRLLAEQSYDAVVIDHAQMGWLSQWVKGHSKLIFNAHNIEHEIYIQNAQATSHPLWRWVYQREARQVRRMENTLAQQVDEVWTLTEHDAEYFSKVTGTAVVRVLTLPSGFAQPRAATCPKTFDVGLIGSWPWKPNEEGLLWFLQRVYPLLPPEYSIHVAGRGADWLKEQYPGITYRGFVPDAQAFMAEARGVAIPMQSGGGIQIKTLDAIAAGSGIVATPTALRGIDNPPATVEVAEDPAVFAQKLVALVQQEQNQENQTAFSHNQPPTLRESQQWYEQRKSKFINELKTATQVLQ